MAYQTTNEFFLLFDDNGVNEKVLLFIEAALACLQAEVDILKVSNLSAEEIASQAGNLYDHWQTMQPEEKRKIVEVMTDKIIIGKDEITINLCYAPLCRDMAKRWRKG